MSTLKEMAATLNLSVMAVSKALRDAPDISVRTKARVQAEAKRRNYIPNRAAQNLRSRRSGLLGVVVPQICDPDYAQMVWGMERQADAVDLQVILAHSLDRAEDEMRGVQKLISRQAEALILVPAVRWQHRLATLELTRASRVPTVLVAAYPAGAENFPQVTWVVCDDQRGGQIATEHLLELGHREILFLAGPNGSSSSAGRFSGYQTALAAAHVPYSEARVYLADKEIESGAQAMAQALAEKVHFSAVVAYNDAVAIGAISSLQKHGLQVPDDVSVVGFGDGLLAENFRVPLTTLSVPQIEMGTAAVQMALQLCRGDKVRPRQMPVELVVRTSTARKS